VGLFLNAAGLQIVVFSKISRTYGYMLTFIFEKANDFRRLLYSKIRFMITAFAS